MAIAGDCHPVSLTQEAKKQNVGGGAKALPPFVALTHKSPFNALPGFPNFIHSLILARRSLDRAPKPASKGKKW
ncbi:hypothetical protein, partial [Sphingomonas sp. BAUL-RG-20F-R05-02]|uniref:hypothetical protein n=1 Tax=Sphingomonas sp. BAUL-RG-20F-R05-02 TaxID=2914830 RepID=UPI001F59DD84